ncbi:DNA topoisomerase IV subunit B [Desulfotalea psychrophila]|uniref:DNA topoisomerase (ATP-hydrolyzing) n=1 Tax=Desulfotalea psychrophila (strain LSv54 / DSM 12343) TaxID=177439 RepID=Q6AKW6_DESPS|nr:DNA topoisomerase IV subunit B [Desulfotalea psychrophila]CAG37009.1 probable topoisomerase IV, subunit B [Desulfotalea psychrophila LSv54]
MTSTPSNYDESKIKTLSSLEHIRKRPGMYIGRLGNGSHQDDGIYILLKEVVDNAVDEFIMGAGKKIDVAVSEEGRVRVRDYGRGIPLGKLVDCVSVINTGAKYNTDVFQFSVGLNGVGTKAVNALSDEFTVTAYRDGKYASATFSQGKLQHKEEGESEEKNGTLINFLPSRDMFPEFSYDSDFVSRRMWRYAYLNAGLKLYFNKSLFYSKEGLRDLLAKELSDSNLYEPIYYKDETLEFAFAHTDSFNDSYYTFVNGTYTSEGGTHLSAFREGVLKGVNEFSGKKFVNTDVRDGIVGTLAVKVKEPVFESQTKNKLGNTEVRSWIVNKVREAVSSELYKHSDTAEILLDKIQRNEKVRKELQSVRKEAKARAKKVSLKIPQLKDCKYHPAKNAPSAAGRENMVFITEGQSAAGSIVSSRDPLIQAVFSMKGKPLNVLGHQLATLYKNEEMYALMRTLNIEHSISDLRFDKVIMATDADVDGLHIRNLLLTFFLHYFEPLVKLGHVYILETPIFRVRNKAETIYCYSEKEKNAAQKKLGGQGKKKLNVEMTRFKGLGEISPKEFKQFIGDDIRLKSVTLDSISEVAKVLSFYMGKNTPERKQYIMDNLVVDPEQ